MSADPAPPSSPSRRRFAPGSGETPAHDDDTPDAVAYRARLGHDGVIEIRTTLQGVLTRLDAWGARWDAWAARSSRLAWIVVPALLLAVCLGAGGLAWVWVSTLHH